MKTTTKNATPLDAAAELENGSSLLKQPRAVWAVFFAGIISFMGIGLVDPILPAIASKLDATPSEVTLLFTSYNAVMALAMIITGAVSSRIGIKKTLLSGIVVIALFSALGGASGDVWTLVGLRGGWGLGNALFVATALTAIVSLSSGGPAKAVILYEAAVGLGISVGPLVGGWLGAISWRGPFFGVAVLMVIAFFAIVFLMPSDGKKANPSVAPVKKTSILDPFRALKHRSLLIFGLGAALYNFGFFTLLAYTPFVLGLDEHGLGYVFLGWGLLLAFTSVVMAPRLSNKFGTIASMCVMLILFALTLFAMGIWTSNQSLIIVCVILAGAFLGNNNTLITTAVMNAAPVERSTASAAYSFLRFLGGAIAPFTAGKLAEVYNPHVPFIFSGVFVILSVILIVWNYEHVKHVNEVEGH
ncbi:MFS transporter [Aciduricibacillus chroicocephali]|uniref:MFS transporter n=1 Tax=Aciduricibacillus chroicocephali TaxID=3054939 RepID=A0ABY9KU74_9BACI|nr:MFS transporter [Bacillaceae bacterium 44XB]